MHRALLLAILALFALAVGPASPRAADPATWLVATSSGGVLVANDGIDLVSLHEGQEVRPGSRIRTLDDGRAVLRRGDDLITLWPNSEIVIPPTQPEFGTRLMQTIGDALYKVTRGAAPHFEVDTPYLAAVVKGTTFAVSSDASGSAVRVVEGRVSVRNVGDGQASFVGAGQVGRVRAARGFGVQVEADDAASGGNGNGHGSNANGRVGGGEP